MIQPLQAQQASLKNDVEMKHFEVELA